MDEVDEFEEPDDEVSGIGFYERASALRFSAVYLAGGSRIYKALCLDIVFRTCL